MGFSSPNSSPNKPLPLPLLSHTTIEFSTFFLRHQVQVVLHKYLWEWGQAWYVVDLPGVTSLEKTDSLSLSQQLSNASSSSASCGSLWPPPPSMLGFCLTWVCTGLVCANTTTVTSYLQLPCLSRRENTVSLTLSTTSGSYNLSPLPRISLSVGCRECDAYVPFRAEYSTVSYFSQYGQVESLRYLPSTIRRSLYGEGWEMCWSC